MTKLVRGWCQLLVSSVTRINLPWLIKLPGSGFITTGFLLEDLSLGNKGKFRESLSAFAVFECLQFTINQYTEVVYFTDGWCVLTHPSFSAQKVALSGRQQ